MKRATTFVSFLLVIGVVAQVAWAEVPFLHRRTPVAAELPAASTISTPTTKFVEAHVPRGPAILYVTNAQSVASPYAYFLLSTALVDRNQVWWAAPVPVTNATEWWHDVSSGTPALEALSIRFSARYVVFDNVPVPADLPVAAVWRQGTDLVVVELTAPGGS